MAPQIAFQAPCLLAMVSHTRCMDSKLVQDRWPVCLVKTVLTMKYLAKIRNNYICFPRVIELSVLGENPSPLKRMNGST